MSRVLERRRIQAGAGRFRHRLTFQEKPIPELQDSFGAPKEEWAETSWSPVWGSYQQLGSREFPIGQKRHAETTARFVIRYRKELDSDKHRILFQDRIWNIYPPSSRDGRPISLEIEASELK